MVSIRLTRRGARNQPFYHVVVTDSRKRQGGPSLEHVGFFTPLPVAASRSSSSICRASTIGLAKAPQPSDRVRSLVASYRKQATA